MPSQDKLIKQGILLTDNLFDEIAKRLSRGVKASDTLEAFLNQTKEYTTNNPLVLNGYKDKMLELILQETNNHKFSRPAQRELTRATIEKRVGDRIVDVGEDIVQSVRDIVKWGYNNNKSQDEIADEITHRVDVIKNTRARTIARTEVARTATASDYVINKERGATHFTVDCRDTCCPICRKDYNFGNVEYTIDQVEMLPPRHPNCRCYARYSIKGGSGVKASKKPYPAQSSTGVREPTKEQLSNNLTAMERSKYANYKRLVDSHTKWLNDNPDASANQIENHKKKLAAALVKLNELKAKALGGSVPASKSKTAPKPKTPSKPKSKSKKPKTGEKLPTPTTKQLKENLTPDELKKYKRYQKEIKEGKLSPAFLEIRKKDLENLTRKALGLKPLKGTTSKRPTPKKTSTPKKPESTSKPKLPKTKREQKSKSTTSKKPASTTQTITDESKTLIPPKVTKKLDNFGKEYGNSSKEHMQFFTENNSSEASHGSTGTVSKSGKQIQFLQQETEKGNVIHGTHTHPNDHKHYTMLSHEDVVDVFMRLNNDGINLGSFSAENKRNRITVVKLPNYNQYTEYSKRSGVKVDLRMAINGAFATHVEDYHNVRGSSSGGELQFLREKRAELKEKYPDIKGYELMEKMKPYEEEASKIDWEKDHRKKIDNAYKEMIKNVNKDLERFGIRFEVEYKD